MILVIEQEGKFCQSPETRQSFKLPAFLLKFWAKRIAEIISKNEEPRESELLILQYNGNWQRLKFILDQI